MSYKTEDFFAYHAGNLAVHPEKPFQVCNRSIPCLLAYKATEDEAKQTVDALQADMDKGILPVNLKEWDKHDQYLK